MKIAINVTFFGNCKASIEFYKRVLGAELVSYKAFKDVDELSGLDLSEGKGDFVYRAEIQIGNENQKYSMIMGDSPSIIFDAGQLKSPNNRDNLTLHIQCDDEDKAMNIYEGLMEDGKRNTPMERNADNILSGSLIDAYGICWIVTV